MREAVRKITRLSSRHAINYVYASQYVVSAMDIHTCGYLLVIEGLIVLLQLQSDAGPDILCLYNILVGWI